MMLKYWDSLFFISAQNARAVLDWTTNHIILVLQLGQNLKVGNVKILELPVFHFS